MARTFDTLAAARRLSDAGMERGQAEAVTAEIREAVDSGAATKADIAILEARLTWRMVQVGLGVVTLVADAVFALLRFMLP